MMDNKKIGELTCEEYQEIHSGCDGCPFESVDCRGFCNKKFFDAKCFLLQKYTHLEPLRQWFDEKLNRDNKA